MRQSVKDAFVAFSSVFEGVVPWMYLDVKGLVTTAIGNLIDPVQYALQLPFIRPDGQEAEVNEILAEWKLVKANTNLARQGYTYARHVTQLRLTPEGVEQVVGQKMRQNDRHIAGRYPEFQDWPADAQLFAHSMAWACGPGFRFPLLDSFLRAQKFDKAAEECTINETGNLGLVPRNVANRILLRNAAVVVTSVLDPDKLYYPNALKPGHEVAIMDLSPPGEADTGSGPTIHPLEYPQ